MLLLEDAHLAVENSYNEIIKIVLHLTTVIDHNLHSKLFDPLTCILSKHSINPLIEIKRYEQQRIKKTGERVIDLFIDNDFSKATNASIPILNMASRNKNLSHNLLITFSEIEDFLTKYNKS